MVVKRRLLSAVLITGTLALTSDSRLNAHPEVSLQNADRAATPTQLRQDPVPVRLTAPAGTLVRVRLNSALRTGVTRPGDRFTGVLTAPIISRGARLVPRGATVTGVVRTSQPSGRLKGRAVLSLALDSVRVGGQSVPLSTYTLVRTSDRHRRRNTAIIGGGAGTGALIGGLAGGGAGALIGAGAGAAAGTAGAVITGKKQTGLSAESVVVFRLKSPLRI
jgi:hypothetical protein